MKPTYIFASAGLFTAMIYFLFRTYAAGAKLFGMGALMEALIGIASLFFALAMAMALVVLQEESK